MHRDSSDRSAPRIATSSWSKRATISVVQSVPRPVAIERAEIVLDLGQFLGGVPSSGAQGHNRGAPIRGVWRRHNQPTLLKSLQIAG